MIHQHLINAQASLMEAAAQARINEDRAMFQVAQSGQYRPLLRTATQSAEINLILAQLNQILQRQDDARTAGVQPAETATHS